MASKRKSYKDLSDKKLEKLKQKAKNQNKTIVLGTGKQSEPQYIDYSTAGDKKRKALPPGKRISKNGKVYYAYRKDHTDKRFRRV